MNKRCMGCMNEYSEELEICPYCGFEDTNEPISPLHMEPGTYLADRYIVGRVIGYGGFGVTYIGWDAKLEQKVAIKEYLPSEFSTRAPGHSKLTVYSGDKAEQFSKGLSKFTDEAKRLAKFQNTAGIVKVYDSFEENQTAYIIMEYLDGETLADKLKREGVIAADDAIALLMPIMESLETVHKEGILHRDIAPDNIFITKDGNAKLIDFGAARYATTGYSMSLTVLIKPGFSPEEQYRTKGDQGPYTDVYSMAATLYRTVTGKTPPDSLKRRVEFEKSKKDILFPLHNFIKDIPESTENAIMNALNVRIEDRTPTMSAFINELKSDNVKRVGNKIRRIDLFRWPLWAKISVPIVTLVLIATSILFGLGIIGFDSNLKNEIEIPEGKTRIPNVVNTELYSAEDKLKELELRIFVEGQEFSNDIPMNFIKLQTPGGGTVVDKMTNINVHISAGIDGEVMPDFFGMSSEDAKAQLELLGFVCEFAEDFDDTIAAGCVMKQSAEAGKEAAKGSTVSLTISKGRDPSKEYPAKEVKVINFVGMSYKDAIISAAKEELIIKVSENKYSDSVPDNTVMAQSVPADSVITNDKVIELTISLGKKTVVVPYVIGATEASAKAAISEKELKVSVEYQNSDSFAAGLVMSQSIAAKKEVTPGTKIIITVSKGVGSLAVPNVVGKTENNAAETLNNQGFKVTVSYGGYSSSVPYGSVLSQSPSAGSSQIKGSIITLMLSKGPDWSSYSDSLPSGVTSDKYEIKSQVLYRYRDKETTTDYRSSLNGWTQYDSSWSWDSYGSWSSWSDSPVSNSDSRDVETRKLYRYYRWRQNGTTKITYCENAGKRYYGGTWYKEYYGGEGNWMTEYKTPYAYSKWYCGSHKGEVFNEWRLGGNTEAYSYYCEDVKTQYRYRDRSQVYTYYYYRWKSWSDYSTTKYTADDNCQVETKTQYSYRRK